MKAIFEDIDWIVLQRYPWPLAWIHHSFPGTNISSPINLLTIEILRVNENLLTQNRSFHLFLMSILVECLRRRFGVFWTKLSGIAGTDKNIEIDNDGCNDIDDNDDDDAGSKSRSPSLGNKEQRWSDGSSGKNTKYTFLINSLFTMVASRERKRERERHCDSERMGWEKARAKMEPYSAPLIKNVIFLCDKSWSVLKLSLCARESCDLWTYSLFKSWSFNRFSWYMARGKLREPGEKNLPCVGIAWYSRSRFGFWRK